MEILIAGASLGALGLAFGLLLGYFNKVFAAPVSEQVLAVREALPGANCGGCGFSGCDAFAEAVVEGKAGVSGCPVGGTVVAQKIAGVLGLSVDEVDEMQRKVATVLCRGGTNYCRPKYNYHGVNDCVAAAAVSDGTKSCHFACLGLGTCATVCAFGAIRIDERYHLVEVDREKCTGCGKCVGICPKHVLDLQPLRQPVRLLCHANERGRVITDNCKAGCFSCGKCVEACKFGAIEMAANLPVINLDKCKACMMCAEACPVDAIWADYANRLEAVIDTAKCIGCGLCRRACQFDAIVGERRQKHVVTNACTGCAQCVSKCPKQAISTRTRLHLRDEYSQMDAPTVY
ncbi:MAG: RnfABCDGE type electron transport complex subunit B [Oscillospiraceae bacterium]|jgi:Na+-translocating ferredoxin:NAD+ oxidoreductase RNF subunit RnfB|nr:RnfABCDGE type electron transport complex subunit B [Oscillospiraceae bacterium]